MASNGTRFLGNRPINVKKVRKKSETEEELLNKEELVRNISENEATLHSLHYVFLYLIRYVILDFLENHKSVPCFSCSTALQHLARNIS